MNLVSRILMVLILIVAFTFTNYVKEKGAELQFRKRNIVTAASSFEAGCLFQGK